MNSNNVPSLGPLGPVDIKDPRIRITFADVAMKFVQDLPTYFGLLVVLALAVLKVIDGIHAVGGIAFVYQARSRPPESQDKYDKIVRGAALGVLAIVFMSGTIAACK